MINKEKIRRYYIKTYGCQMNDSDSEKLEGGLLSFGLAKAQKERDADIILVNTCVVRQNAEDRATGYLNSLKKFKRDRPGVVLGLCGCLVTEPGRDPRKMFPHIDLFIPPNSPETLIEYLNLNWKLPAPSGAEGEIGNWKLSKHDQPGTTYVSIMHGCNNFCSYCIVPYVRGREISRPMNEVLAEIKQKLEQGAKTIMLLGQNVNSYQYGLANLLRTIEKLSPLFLREGRLTATNQLESKRGEFVSFMTSHPRDMSDEIIQAVHDLPYVAKEFHLPLQSGDNAILKAMNRGYTVEYFRDRVKKIRELMPKARITSDVLVGFPGETEEQFQHTLDLVKEIGFNGVNMFAYSTRPQTASANLPGHICEEVKHERLQRMITLVRSML